MAIEAARTAYAWNDVKNWKTQANELFANDDKAKHRWLSEQLAREHGADISAIYGIAKEIWDLVDRDPSTHPEWEDLLADFEGIANACGL